MIFSNFSLFVQFINIPFKKKLKNTHGSRDEEKNTPLWNPHN